MRRTWELRWDLAEMLINELEAATWSPAEKNDDASCEDFIFDDPLVSAKPGQKLVISMPRDKKENAIVSEYESYEQYRETVGL